MITSMHASMSRDLANGTFDEGIIRHLTLNMIRSNNVRFRNKYGRIVICCDSKKSWRKEVFPFYKAARKSDRAKQKHIDWPKVFELLESIKNELREYSNYPIVEVAGAEGDDIIASLVFRYSTEPNIIISADRDFVQLQAWANVQQYDPISSRMITVDDPVNYLNEHILDGDRGDGIPNILSDDDTFVIPTKRQGTLTKKKIEQFMSSSVADWCNAQHQNNWKRNRELIDLRRIPPHIVNEAVKSFNNQLSKTDRKFFDYFVKFGLANLLDCASDF